MPVPPIPTNRLPRRPPPRYVDVSRVPDGHLFWYPGSARGGFHGVALCDGAWSRRLATAWKRDAVGGADGSPGTWFYNLTHASLGAARADTQVVDLGPLSDYLAPRREA